VSQSLFRQEAVEFHARGREAVSGVLRLDSRRMRWAYWMTLALVAAGLALSVLVRTDASTTGPAVVDGQDGTFSALLPAAAAPELEDARSLRIHVGGRRSGPAWSGVLTRVRPAEESLVRRAGLDQPQEPAILLTGRLTGAAGAAALPWRTGVDGRVTVVLRSERVGSVFVDRLRRMLGPVGDDR
jgi:hypothetical protein